jgi:hypothetical protein
MLDNAAFAFTVMTAEDEQLDGKQQARMNVIHELGLFQDRLGFEKAIILLEDGCEQFSNIEGLGQIYAFQRVISQQNSRRSGSCSNENRLSNLRFADWGFLQPAVPKLIDPYIGGTLLEE